MTPIEIFPLEDYDIVKMLYDKECKESLTVGYFIQNYSTVIAAIDHEINSHFRPFDNKNLIQVAAIDIDGKKPLQFKKFKRLQNTLLRAKIDNANVMGFTLEIVNR